MKLRLRVVNSSRFGYRTEGGGNGVLLMNWMVPPGFYSITWGGSTTAIMSDIYDKPVERNNGWLTPQAPH
jgi:hypothetical protein